MGTHTNTFSYKHEKTQTNHTLTKTKMEAERRSTMSSLKGQLSNVEGSIKSMKVAVVVGSVLTVACLAAVFGVTVLANEVSKEVKVSNGTLTSKSGKAVLTTNSRVTYKVGLGAETLGMNNASFKINAVVVNGETTTVICDDLVAVQKDGATSMTVTEGSVLASVLGAEESVEKRSVLSWSCGFDFDCWSSWAVGKICGDAAEGAVPKGRGLKGRIASFVAENLLKEACADAVEVSDVIDG